MPKADTSRNHKSNYELDMFALPDPIEPPLKDIWFNHQLSKEIRSRYVDQFGSVDTEALIYRNTRYAEMHDKAPDQSSFDATRNQRRQFGEFIIKRLLEWHVDNEMKAKPELRRAYEIKQALSEVTVPVTANSKLEVHLSLVGDSINILYLNPYIKGQYVIDPVLNENKFILSKSIDTKTNVQTEIFEKDGVASIEIQRLFPRNASASLKESSWYNPVGITPRESKTSVLFGKTF